MAILNILEFPDPRLRTIAKPVDVVDDALRQLIDDMFETMYDAPGIGLAATQVNVHKRLVVMDLSEDKSEPRVFINPELETLTEDLGPYQAVIDDLRLVDFKVRITQGGTDAVTRVIIDSEDASGRRWSTVGVSANLVDASFEALLDAINWKLIRDVGAPA